jgi:hypothetical protein
MIIYEKTWRHRGYCWENLGCGRKMTLSAPSPSLAVPLLYGLTKVIIKATRTAGILHILPPDAEYFHNDCFLCSLYMGLGAMKEGRNWLV